jgi:hypothetical protein
MFAARTPREREGIEMKMRIIAPLAMAATAAAIGLAPIAAAAPTAEMVDSSVVQSPGNAQVTATPGDAALQAGQMQYPWFGFGYGGLLFHHGGHR